MFSAVAKVLAKITLKRMVVVGGVVTDDRDTKLDIIRVLWLKTITNEKLRQRKDQMPMDLLIRRPSFSLSVTH